MENFLSQPSDDDPNSDELDLPLLRGAQSFLECLQRHEVPSAKNQDDWSRFYLICDALMRRYARCCHVRSGDLDDCLQSAWREVTAALPRFDNCGQIGRFCSWLRRIVHSKATDVRRYHMRHPLNLLTPNDESRLVSRDADPATLRENKDRRLRMRIAVRELRKNVSPKNFRVFKLCCILGRPAHEVAARLKMTSEQVHYRCFRMKQKFRQLLQPNAGQE